MEDLRTTLQTGLTIEKDLRGVDLGLQHARWWWWTRPGGGGKRDAHSYEHYDRTTGVSVYTSPAVQPGQLYLLLRPHRPAAARRASSAGPIPRSTRS